MVFQQTNKTKREIVSWEDWVASGRDVFYDRVRSQIVPRPSRSTVSVHEKVVITSSLSETWLTFLPDMTVGSFGYARVEEILRLEENPRLYMEYETASSNQQVSIEKMADLVETQWEAHGIKKTIIVSAGHSSLVMMELLQRQKERTQQREPNAAEKRLVVIEHVMTINGYHFSDSHGKTFAKAPLLRTGMDRLAGRSDIVLKSIIQALHSRGYKATKDEITETEKAIRRNPMIYFCSNAAYFAEEHKLNAYRWDLYNVYTEFCLGQGITFQIVGSVRETKLVNKRLGQYHPNIAVSAVNGGHMTSNEEPGKIASLIRRLARKRTTSTRFDTSITPVWRFTEPCKTSIWSHDTIPRHGFAVRL